MHPKQCPCCKYSWYSDETITEYFTCKYEIEGVPECKRNEGFVDPHLAALDTAGFYGDTPLTPKHFGINIMGMEEDRDYIEWWGCTKCGARVNRFTHKIEQEHQQKEMLINYGKQGRH